MCLAGGLEPVQAHARASESDAGAPPRRPPRPTASIRARTQVANRRWDMAHMPHGEASLTMEDQAEANLVGEEIATVGVDWQSGADLAQAWNDMMQ